MQTEKLVFEKLFSADKVELESQRIELGIIQDAIQNSQDAIKEFQTASSIISNAKSKADVNLKESYNAYNV